MLDEGSARRLAEALQGRDLAVTSVESKPYTRKPYAPFMTSTLQQEAGRKLRFSAERTMRTAQRLYENGYITYMRTDSTTLSESAINAARAQARELYGDAYVSAAAAAVHAQGQERAGGARGDPAGRRDASARPGEVAREVDGDDFRLYELIWQRTVASQMADARGTTVSVRITGDRRHRRGVHVRRVRAHDHVRRASSRPTSRPSTTRPAARPTTPSRACRS